MSERPPTLRTLLTTEEVARRLSVSRSLVYELVVKGKLPHHRVGVGRGTIRISEDDVAEFLRCCRIETREETDKNRMRPSRVKLRHLRG